MTTARNFSMGTVFISCDTMAYPFYIIWPGNWRCSPEKLGTPPICQKKTCVGHPSSFSKKIEELPPNLEALSPKTAPPKAENWHEWLKEATQRDDPARGA